MFDADLFGNKSVPESVSIDTGSSVDHIRRGQVGQYLVAADICGRNYDCSVCSEGLPYDLMIHIGSRHISVQVKSACLPNRTAGNVISYGFNRVLEYAGKVDILAFVALEPEIIIYELPKHQVTNFRSINPKDFTEVRSKASWNYVAKALCLNEEEEELLKDWTWTPGI